VVVSSRLVRSVPKGGRRVTRGSTLGRPRMPWQVRVGPKNTILLAGQIGPRGSVLAEDPFVRWPSIGSSKDLGAWSLLRLEQGPSGPDRRPCGPCIERTEFDRIVLNRLDFEDWYQEVHLGKSGF
jgi:hypothetical protein